MRMIRLLAISFVCAIFMASCAPVMKIEPGQTTPTDFQEEVSKATPTTQATVATTTDSCVECHTDKDQIIKNAKPEVVVEKESTGTG